MRGGGEIEVLQSLFGPVAPVFALVTQLGDPWVLFTVVGTVYWLDGGPFVGAFDRERGALFVALGLGATAVTTTLKEALQLPRPPATDAALAADWLPALLAPLYESAVTATGFGFPSGHAVGTTVVWGGLALLSDRGSRRHRLALAAGVVSFVSLSRVVLGVHYGVDVLAGITVGVGYLGVVLQVADTPRRAFAVAAAVACVGVLTSGFTADGTRVLGATVAAALAWSLVGESVRNTAVPGRGRPVVVAVGLVIAGGPLLAVEVLGPPVPVAFLGSVVTAVALLALPLVVARVEKTSVFAR